MTMQYDVKSAKVQGPGFLYVGRVRLKQATVLGNGTAGYIDFFDTDAAPTAATYARALKVVTVTKTAHGLSTGDYVGISFVAAGGVAPVSGNYQITRVDADTFTFTDLNSGTIAGGTVCHYVSGSNKWVIGINTGTNLQPFQILIPSEGIVCATGIYSNSSNITSTQIIYG
jgi:hypothetical protein